MSQFPPASRPVSVPLVPRTSGLAVASLVCSLIFCIPLLGLAGAIVGIAALRSTRRPGVGGRGLAIGGVIVGLVTTAMWIAGSIGAFVSFRMVLGAADQPVAAFISDYNAANDRAIYDAASADFRKNDSYAKLHDILEEARTQWGTCSKMGTWEMMTGGGFNVMIRNSQMEASMPLRFAKAGPQKVSWTFINETGQWRIQHVRFHSLTPATTQPVER